MTKYNSKVRFHLPGVFVFSKFYKEFVEFANTHKDYFRDNVEIGSIYGAPFPCIWNGGRMMENPATAPVIRAIKEFMERYNIPIRLTYTNMCLEDKHLYDTYSNVLTDILHNGKHEILCNTPLLENYLRTNYPNFGYISSTTKRLLDIDSLNEELEKDYNLVVLDYAKNKDFDFIKQIKHPEKIEILCNAVCQPDCPIRKTHYENISKAILEFDITKLMQCEHSGLTFGKAMARPHFVSADDINKYLELGIHNFKLEGRTSHLLDVMEMLIYYLIKDEYQILVRQYLQSTVF